MENTPKITAVKRSGNGKNLARTLRNEGKVPAIVYGEGKETVSIALDNVELTTLLRHHKSENIVADLVIDGEAPQSVLLQDLQHEIMSRSVLHVDFLRLSSTHKITLQVEVQLKGDAVGIEAGGVLDQLLHEVSVECLPANVPEVIMVDVSGLKVGDMLSLADVVAPKGVEIMGDPEVAVASVNLPRLVDETEDEEGAEGAEGEEAEEVATED